MESVETASAMQLVAFLVADNFFLACKISHFGSVSHTVNMILWWSVPQFVIILTLFLYLRRRIVKTAVHAICGHRQLSANNPFAKDSRRPKRRFITDRRMRDAILRREFDRHNVSKQGLGLIEPAADIERGCLLV